MKNTIETMLAGQVDPRVYVGNTDKGLLEAIHANVPIIVAAGNCCDTVGDSEEILDRLEQSKVDIYYKFGCGTAFLHTVLAKRKELMENPYFRGYHEGLYQYVLQNPTLEAVRGILTYDKETHKQALESAGGEVLQKAMAYANQPPVFLDAKDVGKKLEIIEGLHHDLSIARSKYDSLYTTITGRLGECKVSPALLERLAKYTA